MDTIIIIAAAAVLLAAVILLLGYAAFCKAIRRWGGEMTVDDYLHKPNKFWRTHAYVLYDSMEACKDLEYTDHWTTAVDGLKLYARYYDCGMKDKVIILFHGYRSMSRVDFGSVIRVYMDEGYSVLLIDQRAHGKSEGKYIGFGALERMDVPVWVDYVEKTFAPKHIVLDGISMGAATVLMASSMDLGDKVRCIIADSAFSSPREIIANVAKKTYHVPEHPAVDLIGWYAKKLAKYDINLSSEEFVKQSRYPILFVHGKADSFVPCHMTERAYEACASEKRIEIVEDADHGMSYIKEPERIGKAIRDFFEQYVK